MFYLLCVIGIVEKGVLKSISIEPIIRKFITRSEDVGQIPVLAKMAIVADTESLGMCG